jgi:hypothetical protein
MNRRDAEATEDAEKNRKLLNLSALSASLPFNWFPSPRLEVA